MAVTLNTNSSAYIALANLRTVQSQLQATQKQVSTGFNTADALDNGAVFGVAQGVRANLAGNTAVSQELGNLSGLVSVSSAASTQISNNLSDIRAVLSHLSNTNISANEETQYKAQLTSLVASIKNFIDGANYGSTNLLSTDKNLTILADHQAGNNIAISGTKFGLQTVYADLTAGQGAVAKGDVAQSWVQTSFASVSGTVSGVLNHIGALNRSLETQLNFNANVRSALNNALGALVDADLAAESANLTALQVKQSLSTQSLSIANQGPSALLKLFQ
ncbi:MAG: flagellin [Candidatus Pacebacteria bacterium]|nr:flagellin [Candidatus Paceibacterota bacterium]